MPIGAILLILFAIAVLDPTVQQRIESVLSGFGSAAASGPISTATKWWLLAAGAVGALGVGWWIVETKVAKHEGYDVAPPPVESIGVPAPPTFGASGGFTASSQGGVGLEQRVTAEGGGTTGRGGFGQVTKRAPQAAPRTEAPLTPSRRRGLGGGRAA
ncbi:MAG: hypothetical protein ABSH07_12660 [Candidatus Dormibacteria bacterium]|jgi:hypothetical protein